MDFKEIRHKENAKDPAPPASEYFRNLQSRIEELLTEGSDEVSLSRDDAEQLLRLLAETRERGAGREGLEVEAVGRENALRESEARYRSIAENVGDVIWQLDADFRFTYVSASIRKLLGYEPEELIGESLFSFLTPHSIEVVNRLRADSDNPAAGQRPGNEIVVEVDFIGKDGEARSMEVHSTGYVDVGGTLISYQGVTRDITKRKAAEKELLWKTVFLEALVNSSNDGVLVVDDKGRKIFQNQRLMGMRSLPPDIIADVDDRKQIDHLMREMKDPEGFATRIEYLLAHPDETTVDEIEFTDGMVMERYSSPVLGEDGTHYGRIWTFRDITGRRKAEEALGRSEERYRLLFNSIDDAVFVHGLTGERQSWTFTEVNDVACRHLGYSREELLRLGPADIDTPEGRALVPTIMPTLLEDKHVTWETWHVGKDGRVIPVEISAHLFDLEGVPTILSSVRNITERKSLESQLLQARKMEAIGTLAGGVAHDFNNRLTVIMGFGDLLGAEMDDASPLRPYVDEILASAKKAAGLTQSLLAFSRKQRMTLEPRNVNELVKDAAKLLRRLLPEDIDIALDLSNADAVALVDATLIDQLLMNLATNARDAMPGGGFLTIATEEADLDEKFRETHGFGKPGRYVRLSVSDTGQGMDDKTIGRIFDPFFTTKGVGKGTGLGLASVYGTVKQHNGYITVSSALGRGTTFRIYLPLSHALPEVKDALPKETRGGAETVLVAEDDPGVRNLIIHILETQGYRTMEAKNGEDAVRLFKESTDRIDLVILDVVMPGKSGKEALDEIARIDDRVRGVFVSGYTGDVMTDRGIQSDAVDFVSKPLSVSALLSKVREVLDR